MATLVNPESGQVFEVDDAEAETAISTMGLTRATPEQLDWLQKQREYEAKSFGDKVRETGQAYQVGIGKIGRELGRFRLDDTGLAQSLLPEQAGQVAGAQQAFQERRDAAIDSPYAAEIAERHPLAYTLGVDTPALFISPGVGGAGLRALGGMAAESVAIGASEEAVNRTAEGRDFGIGRAVEIAAYDLGFSGLAHAATQVVSRVGNLLLFGAGNTTAKNIKRGLDESAGPVVPDDVRFDGPLLEAETRSRRTAAAQGPGMPPGPERDELLRRSAADLNDQVKTQGADLIDETLTAAKSSASVADEAVSRRIDEALRDTTPAQTAWSADATRKLDETRTAMAATTDEVAAPFVARVREIADEAIAAIDGSAESASWFRASSSAREQLDSLADDIAASGLPPTHRAGLIVDDARGFFNKSLTDRSLFGAAADMHAGIYGVSRDKISMAVKNAGGDMRAALGEFVSADAATRQTLRRPIEQAIEGFEELAAAHERFGTGSPRAIEGLRENAAKLRRGLKLADDVQSAQRSAPKAPPKPPPAPAAKEPDFSRADTISDQIRQKAAKAGVATAQKVVDYAAGPGRGVYDDAVSDVLKGAIQSVAAIGGLAVLGPPGFVAGWLGARSLGKKYSPQVGQSILDAAQRYVKKHGADTAGAALLATAALGNDGNTNGGLAANVAGLGLLSRRSMFRLGKRSPLPSSSAEKQQAFKKLLSETKLNKTQLDYSKDRSVLEADRSAAELLKTLSDGERAALNEYTRGDHASLRSLVQGEDVAAEALREAGKHVPNLASAIDKMTVQNPTKHGTIYRGVPVDQDGLAELLTQDRYITSAPTSASYDANVARGFGTAKKGSGDYSVVLRFNKVNEGAPLLNSGASRAIGEWEILLPRNQEYRITKRNVADGGILVIDLEQVGKADKIDLSEVGMLGLLGATAAQGALGGEDSDTLAASVGGLFFAKRFAERALGSAGRGVKAAGKGAYRASEAVAGTVDAATGKVAEAVGQATYKAGRKVGEAIGSTADAVARKAADEEAVKRTISAGIRDPKRWLRRNTRGKIADKVAEYFGPRISKVAREWLEKRGNKSAQEVVDEAVTETAEAGRRDSALLEEHSAQSVAMVEDVGAQIRAALNETAEQKARALAAFPQRIGGDANAQRQLLSSAVDELATALGKVSDGSTAKVAIEFANAAKEAIINARTAKDRFRIGMQLTETLVHHTAEAGDGEMCKVFGAYADKMWEAMGQREVWMGARELEREMKRVAKKRESIISKISAGEKIGIAALVGSAAVEDEDTAAALAATGGLGALVGKGKLMGAGRNLVTKISPEVKDLFVKAEAEITSQSSADGRAIWNWLTDNSEGMTSGKSEAFAQAFDRLAIQEPTQYGPLYRGIALKSSELQNIIQSGEFANNNFASASYSAPLARKYADVTGAEKKVLLAIEDSERGLIAPNKMDAEVILPKGERYEIVDHYEQNVPTDDGSGKLVDTSEPTTVLVLRAKRQPVAAVDPRQLGTIPPKGKAKRPDGPIAAKPERDVTPTKFYPNSNQARNEYGEQMRPYREAQRADNTRMAQLAKDYGLGAAALVAGGGALAVAGDANAAEPEDRMVTAERILAIDQAATQRIRHTARVLAGLAEPPGPEGLTTHLARFGAEHDDPRAAFEERKDILAKSEISPALVYDVLGSSMGDVASVSPELYQAATARLLDNFRYLRENLPPEVKTSLLHPKGMPVSESAMRDWATQWSTAMDPESVLDDIERGTVTHLQIETLRNAHADLYQQLRTEIIEEVGANFQSVPTSTKMQLDILFGADGLAGPMFSSEAAAIIGAAGKIASQRKQPGPPQGAADDQEVAASSNGLEAIRSSVTNRGA